MISRRDVEQVARLARVELTEAEKEKLEGELSAILKFVEKLGEVETRRVEPLTGGTTLEQIVRPDEAVEDILEEKEQLLRNAAPEHHQNWIRVKAIFE